MSEAFPRFSGEVRHALDPKGRLVVPAEYRTLLGSRFVMTVPLGDPCLCLYPAQTWADQLRKIDLAANKNRRHNDFLRELSRRTFENVDCDAQGRLLIPASLREYAGIAENVISIGMHQRVEIWDPERLKRVDLTSDDAADWAAELGL